MITPNLNCWEGRYYPRNSRKTIQNTPFQQHTIFTNTEMLWGGFFFFFLYNFFYNKFFFQPRNSLICMLNILSLITTFTEMWYPKIWIRCWDWWLLNGHLLYGSTHYCVGDVEYADVQVRLPPRHRGAPEHLREDVLPGISYRKYTHNSEIYTSQKSAIFNEGNTQKKILAIFLHKNICPT